jgi:hypothetical protein
MGQNGPCISDIGHNNLPTEGSESPASGSGGETLAQAVVETVLLYRNNKNTFYTETVNKKRWVPR